jgi:hypothetical protein
LIDLMSQRLLRDREVPGVAQDPRAARVAKIVEAQLVDAGGLERRGPRLAPAALGEAVALAGEPRWVLAALAVDEFLAALLADVGEDERRSSSAGWR